MLDSTYEITLARPEHLPLLAAVELSAATLFREFEPAQSVLGEHMPFEVLQGAQREHRLWVALAEEGPVGFALVSMIAVGQPHLLEMDVHPQHGRRGVGSALLRAVCEWTSASGHRQITLTTFRDVPWNMPFYSRFGFVEVPYEQQSAELRSIVEGERERGLDSALRVVMVLHP